MGIEDVLVEEEVKEGEANEKMEEVTQEAEEEKEEEKEKEETETTQTSENNIIILSTNTAEDLKMFGLNLIYDPMIIANQYQS